MAINEGTPGEMAKSRCKALVEATHKAAVASIRAALLRYSIPGCVLGNPASCVAVVAGLLIEKFILDKWRNDALSNCDDTHSSPLALDLDGNGIGAGSLTYIDHEGDGWAETSRWADEGDGVLVWDRNGDGVINDGSELFGDNTVLANGKKAAHGFAALSDLDSNGDGVVNSQDENFADLRVMRWTDANENGTKICF